MFFNFFKKVDKLIRKRDSILRVFHSAIEELRINNEKLNKILEKSHNEADKHKQNARNAEEQLYHNTSLIKNIENLIGVKKDEA